MKNQTCNKLISHISLFLLYSFFYPPICFLYNNIEDTPAAARDTKGIKTIKDVLNVIHYTNNKAYTEPYYNIEKKCNNNANNKKNGLILFASAKPPDDLRAAQVRQQDFYYDNTLSLEQVKTNLLSYTSGGAVPADRTIEFFFGPGCTLRLKLIEFYPYYFTIMPTVSLSPGSGVHTMSIMNSIVSDTWVSERVGRLLSGPIKEYYRITYPDLEPEYDRHHVSQVEYEQAVKMLSYQEKKLRDTILTVAREYAGIPEPPKYPSRKSHRRILECLRAVITAYCSTRVH